MDHMPEQSYDVVFSDQLIEHFHPEDTICHFYLVKRLLKERGTYIFRTPHLFRGPHDVSKYFSYSPEGFHLKEWTYTELQNMSMVVGFRRCKMFWMAKGLIVPLPNLYFCLVESVVKGFPLKLRRKISRFLLPTLYCIFKK